jgi:hypothetical protein
MPIDLPPAPPAIVITEDGGGVVTKYEALVDRYSAENREVRILGSCRSACILYLGAKNVCVGPNAVVKAHMAYEPYTEINRPDITAHMMSRIPLRISARLAPYITEKYNKMTTLSSSQLIELGVRPCSGYAVEASDKPKSHIIGKPSPADTMTRFFFNILGVN